MTSRPVTIDAWSDVPGLIHGFTGRLIPPAAAGDDRSSALRFHDLVAGGIALPRQVHGTTLVVLDELPAVPPEGDGVFTGAPGMAVGVVTADCVPLLLLAPDLKLAGAVHAGWRGTLAGIVSRAVELATARGASPRLLRAAIGPAIGGCCYEVGPEVLDAFEKRYGHESVAGAFTTGGRRPHLDLRKLVEQQLLGHGIPASSIATVGPCTACDTTYASYRRDGAKAGRQVSFAGWGGSPG